MSLNRYAAARDKNEPPIVDYLREQKVKFRRLSGPFDLVLKIGKLLVFWEVKMPKGRLTEVQEKFMTDFAGCPLYIVRSIPEAKAALQHARDFEMQWTLKGG